MATEILICLHWYYMFSHNTSMTPTIKNCQEHNGRRPGKQLARRVVFVAYFGRICDLLSWFLLAIGIESKSSSIKKLESIVNGKSLARSWLNLKRIESAGIYALAEEPNTNIYFWEKVVSLVHSCTATIPEGRPGGAIRCVWTHVHGQISHHMHETTSYYHPTAYHKSIFT